MRLGVLVERFAIPAYAARLPVRNSPAMSRNRLDFPEPLGPRRISTSPSDTAKSRFAKTVRPPRMQPRPFALKQAHDGREIIKAGLARDRALRKMFTMGQSADSPPSR